MTLPLKNKHLFPQTIEEAMTLLKSEGYAPGTSGTYIENLEELHFRWHEDSMGNGYSKVYLSDFNGTYKEVSVDVQTLLTLIELKGTEWKKLTQLAKWRKYNKEDNSRTVVYGRIVK